jgi:hypothetical protein
LNPAFNLKLFPWIKKWDFLLIRHLLSPRACESQNTIGDFVRLICYDFCGKLAPDRVVQLVTIFWFLTWGRDFKSEDQKMKGVEF